MKGKDAVDSSRTLLIILLFLSGLICLVADISVFGYSLYLQSSRGFHMPDWAIALLFLAGFVGVGLLGIGVLLGIFRSK
jgi:hypothetical protein